MVKFKRVPKHIGVIPDGNRRWAVGKGMQKEDGYDYGIDPGVILLNEAIRLGVREVTTYVFTKENTHRPSRQIVAFQEAFFKLLTKINNNGTSILIVGDTESSYFPDELKRYTVPEKDRDEKVRVNFLVNYSWKWDLNMVLENARRKNLEKQDLLDSIGSKDVSRVDLVLRWGERNRLSGFLPIQAAYADIFVIDELWPDFQVDQFHNALKWYETQDVTMGG